MKFSNDVNTNPALNFSCALHGGLEHGLPVLCWSETNSWWLHPCVLVGAHHMFGKRQSKNIPAWSSHLASTGLVLDVLCGTDLRLDVLKVRHGCHRGDGGAAGPWGFRRSADHSHLLHLVSRGAGTARWRFGCGWAAVTTAIRGLGRVS